MELLTGIAILLLTGLGFLMYNHPALARTITKYICFFGAAIYALTFFYTRGYKDANIEWNNKLQNKLLYAQQNEFAERIFFYVNLSFCILTLIYWITYFLSKEFEKVKQNKA
jgi:hypothetical protein